jgi:hypothetical protein
MRIEDKRSNASIAQSELQGFARCKSTSSRVFIGHAAYPSPLPRQEIRAAFCYYAVFYHVDYQGQMSIAAPERAASPGAGRNLTKAW